MYSDTLERDRRILVELNLLFSTMKKIGEEVIDLADVKGVEGRAISPLYSSVIYLNVVNILMCYISFFSGMSFDPRPLRNFVNLRTDAQPLG